MKIIMANVPEIRNKISSVLRNGFDASLEVWFMSDMKKMYENMT